MRNRWLAAMLCLVAVAGLVISMGCNAFTPERNRRRVAVMQSDMDRMVDEVDWLLGLDEPSTLYEDTFTPYR